MVEVAAFKYSTSNDRTNPSDAPLGIVHRWRTD
jgi:hypothetical protein